MLKKMLYALTLYSGTVKDCTPTGSIGTVLNMKIDPIDPKVGDTTYLAVDYDLSRDVTAGTVTYSYSLNYIPFQPTVVSLCDQTPCPLLKGIHTDVGNSTFPDVSGRLEVKIEWDDVDGTPIWCVDTVYNV